MRSLFNNNICGWNQYHLPLEVLEIDSIKQYWSYINRHSPVIKKIKFLLIKKIFKSHFGRIRYTQIFHSGRICL